MVLIVEEDTHVRTSLQRWFEDAGWSVAVADCLSRCAELPGGRRPDYVLVAGPLEPSRLAALAGTGAELDDRPRNDTLGNLPPLNLVEEQHIKQVLAACNGNVSGAARVLGVHRRTLQRRLHRAVASPG